MICNDCGRCGINRKCKYAVGMYGCSVLQLLSREAFNREYGHAYINDITIAQCTEEDQWCATIPTSDGSFIILGWYKNKPYMESAIIMDERKVRPLTFNDVEKYVIDNNIEEHL